MYGLVQAYRHFFLDNPQKIEGWEAFILIERLANVRNHFLGRRVFQLMERLVAEGVVKVSECEKALSFYDQFKEEHFRLSPNDLSPKDVLGKVKELKQHEVRSG